MKKVKSFIFILFVAMLVGNCSTLKEGFINDKKNGTDEFLVKKKQQLTMPPNFEKLPLPNTTLDVESDKEQKVFSLEKILKTSSNEAKSDNQKDITSSTESFILKEIKK
jgi:PBP1b-binding outer membrane lipoprotein LpoB